MKLKVLPYFLSVCQIDKVCDSITDSKFYFLSKTDDELSLVCLTEDVPAEVKNREDGWRGFYIDGVLDFSLIGILSKISGILADAKIGIFAVSTYNTDYILVKEENFQHALEVLSDAGYFIENENS